MTVLGVLTIGQAPRPDGLTRDVRTVLGPNFDVVERGALDGLGRDDVERLAPGPTDDVLVTLLSDGTPVRISKKPILDRLQSQIDRLENEDRVAATLVMCTGKFPAFRHRQPLVLPQRALYGAVIGLAGGGRVGSLAPVPAQLESARGKWAASGIDDAVVLPADPYSSNPNPEIRAAAQEAREAGARILFMDCFGYDLAMRAAAQEAFGGPVVLARSLAARLAAEIAA
jgi:protein AroM